MPTRLLHQIILEQAQKTPSADALIFNNQCINYQQLADSLYFYANIFSTIGIQHDDRVAIYLPKQIETIVALFSCSLSASISVPINPKLKSHQLQHILNDCEVRLLITSSDRLNLLRYDIEHEAYNNLEFIFIG